MKNWLGFAFSGSACAGRGAARAAATVAIAALSGGCSNVPIYNEVRDKQGQELTQATSKIDLVALVDAVQARFAALSELDLKTRQVHADMRRDLEVAVVVGNAKPLKESYVDNFLDARMKRLTGAALTPADWRKSNDALVAAGVYAQDARKEVRRFAKVVQADLDSCGDLDAYGAKGVLKTELGEKLRPAARLIYKDAAALCEKAEPPATVVAAKSHIHELMQGLNKAQAAQVERSLAIADMQNRVQEAKKAYDDEVKALTPKADDATYRARLAAAAEKLGKALKAIESAAEKEKKIQAFLQASTLENIQALEQVSEVVASGETDVSSLTDGQRRSVAILRLLPTMADDADRLLKEAQRPRVAPLMLSLEQQRLVLESYQQEQKLQDRQVASYRQAVDLAWQEYHSLGRARYLVESNDAASRVPLDMPLSGVMSARNPKQLYALYSSLAEYFDHSQLLRVQSEAAEIAARSYLVDREMLRSRYAALQWQKLLNDMSGVLADYHKAGVKPQDIAEFGKALGLLYIGNQTGK